MLTHQWNEHVLEEVQRLSPLYLEFMRQMDNDPEILALEALVEPHQPRPITFFAIVNALLIRDQQHPLAGYYPYLSSYPEPAQGAYPAFRDFCLTHLEELQTLLPGARLQTNEVSRCSNWLPALELVYRRGGLLPLHLVEIGCSAGLNLLVDQYRYLYRDQDNSKLFHSGIPSPVHIECTLKGDLLPPIPVEMPRIARRWGIDLHPLDLHNEDHVRLLLGAIWPEERDRYVLLKGAIAQAQHSALQILEGEAASLLPEVVAAIPRQHTACFLHSYALRQGPPAILEQIEELLADFSRQRPVYRIALEIEQGHWEMPRLELFTYEGGQQVDHEWLAICEVHGDAMRWLHVPEQHI